MGFPMALVVFGMGFPMAASSLWQWRRRGLRFGFEFDFGFGLMSFLLNWVLSCLSFFWLILGLD